MKIVFLSFRQHRLSLSFESCAAVYKKNVRRAFCLVSKKKEKNTFPDSMMIKACRLAVVLRKGTVRWKERARMSKASARRCRQHSWASARTLEGERHVHLALAAIRGLASSSSSPSRAHGDMQTTRETIEREEDSGSSRPTDMKEPVINKNSEVAALTDGTQREEADVVCARPPVARVASNEPRRTFIDGRVTFIEIGRNLLVPEPRDRVG